MIYNWLVGSDEPTIDNSQEDSPECFVGGSKRLVPESHQSFAFVEARPQSISGFFTPIATDAAKGKRVSKNAQMGLSLVTKKARSRGRHPPSPIQPVSAGDHKIAPIHHAASKSDSVPMVGLFLKDKA